MTTETTIADVISDAACAHGIPLTDRDVKILVNALAAAGYEASK